jgi:hypothetical protein
LSRKAADSTEETAGMNLEPLTTPSMGLKGFG